MGRAAQAAAALTPEQRRERGLKRAANIGPACLSAAAKKGHESRGAKGRSAAAKKGNATRRAEDPHPGRHDALDRYLSTRRGSPALKEAELRPVLAKWQHEASIRLFPKLIDATLRAAMERWRRWQQKQKQGEEEESGEGEVEEEDGEESSEQG